MHLTFDYIPISTFPLSVLNSIGSLDSILLISNNYDIYEFFCTGDICINYYLLPKDKHFSNISSSGIIFFY